MTIFMIISDKLKENKHNLELILQSVKMDLCLVDMAVQHLDFLHKTVNCHSDMN